MLGRVGRGGKRLKTRNWRRGAQTAPWRRFHAEKSRKWGQLLKQVIQEQYKHLCMLMERLSATGEGGESCDVIE